MQQHEEIEDELVLSVSGMSCSACATRIERSLSKLEHIEHVAVSYPLRTAWIKGDPSKLDMPNIIAKIIALGFKAKPYTSSIDEMKQEKRLLQRRLLIAIVLTLPLLCSMAEHIPLLHPLLSLLPKWIFAPWLQLLLATCVQFIVGIPFYISAYHAIREKLANMDVLVVIGTTAAYLYSHYEVFANGLEGLLRYASFDQPQLYFETSAVVITVVLLGKYIELTASLRLQEQHEPFAQLQVQEVIVERDGHIFPLRVAYVVPGDIIHQSNGQVIGIDGIIVDGEAYIDEALLTGEQQFIYKTRGDQVWAGTLISQGELRIQATSAGNDTLLQRIRELVKQGQRSKTNIQRQVDAVVRWFVPLIILLALATGAIWLLAGAQQSTAVLSTLAVMLVACPCALGLAAPISLSIASSRMVKHGVIVKDASVIERLHHVDEIIFDKTGTLTEGKLSVSFVHSFYRSKHRLLSIAASLEQVAEHPIAQAIRSYAEANEIELLAIHDAKHQLGYGVIGTDGKHRYLIGNERLLVREGKVLQPYVTPIVNARLPLGETLTYVYEDDRCIGLIGLSDQIKSTTIPAIAELKRMHVAVSMATGDQEGTAYRIGKDTGIEQLHANLLPDQKLELVKQKQESKRVVAMVGDGWNDAPALAGAHIGIAMSNGTEAALHAGHMTLLHSQLTSIPLSIQMSRTTVKNIKQNLMFALIYNCFMLPVAALGYLKPWMAGVAMSLSSLCVVFNALLLHPRLNKLEGSKDDNK